MLSRFSFLFIVVFLISCGKNEIVIIDTPIPNESEEIFEVNLVGFTTDSNRESIDGVHLSIDNREIISDDSGLFHQDKILIGKKGLVLTTEIDGYLPSAKRIHNYRSIEPVTTNASLIVEPSTDPLAFSGGTINRSNGRLVSESGAIASDGDFIFHIPNRNAKSPLQDHLFDGSGLEYLIFGATAYVAGNSEIRQGSTLEIRLDRSQFDNIDLSVMKLYFYDFIETKWIHKKLPLEQIDNEIVFSINEYGWWTIAESVPAIYGEVRILQENDLPISHQEISLGFSNENSFDNQIFTGKNGEIAGYFPSSTPLAIHLNDNTYSEYFNSGISKDQNNIDIRFGKEVVQFFNAKVYNCDIENADGYVAVISQNSRSIYPVVDGSFEANVFDTTDDIILNFYDVNFQFKNGYSSKSNKLISENNSFLICENLEDNLKVKEAAEVVQDFDMCRVKIRPNETLIIGERSNSDVFLVSYLGEGTGIFEGLIYFPLITDYEVDPKVSIHLVLHDKINNKMAGFINTNYLESGDELSISFIGNIE